MKRIVFIAVAAGLVACGDPATEDTRGYTKAPLETPGLMIAGEDASSMDALGTPDRPRPPRDGRSMMDVEDDAGAELDGDMAGGSGSGEATSVTLAAGVTREQYDRGESLYTSSGCTACHGPNAGGSQLAPDLTDSEWLHVDGSDVSEIAMVIRNGVMEPMQYPAAMPAMGGANLTDDEIEALAGYVASLGASN